MNDSSHTYPIGPHPEPACEHPRVSFRNRPNEIARRDDSIEALPGITVDNGSLLRTNLRLVTLNIWGLPPLSNLGSDDRRRFARLRHAIVPEHFDVVALQEVWSTEARHAAQSLRFPHRVDSRRLGFLGTDGLTTLSIHPVTHHWFRPFRTVAGLERLVAKGVLYSRHRLPHGGCLHMFNVHLISEPERANRLFLSRQRWKAVRRAQIDELGGWIQAARDESGTVVVLGDFNVADTEPEYETLRGIAGNDLFRCAPPQASGSSPHYHRYTFDPLANPWARSPSGRPERIDYIFLQGDEQVSFVSARCEFVQERLSDHFGVSAEVRVSARRPISQFDTSSRTALCSTRTVTEPSPGLWQQAFPSAGWQTRRE